MPKLAFLTVGLLHEEIYSPRSKGFLDRLPEVYTAADHSDGFDSRSIRDLATYKHSWGEVIPPACYAHAGEDNRFAMTLSLWSDLESVAAFAYHGPHADALTKRHEWFVKFNLPAYVAWWVADEVSITWTEGSERLDHLYAHGSTLFAFNFAKPFDSQGKPVRLDSAAVRLKAALNSKVAPDQTQPPAHLL